LIDENLTIKYKWFAPKLESVHHRILTTDYARKVYDLLNRSEELIEETKEFIGFVKQADVEKGNWRILNESDNKEYNGESAGKSLEGITLETVRYKILCQEIIEELTVSEKEKVKYVLKSIDKVE
jgi:copper homeostasis protein CutC